MDALVSPSVACHEASADNHGFSPCPFSSTLTLYQPLSCRETQTFISKQLSPYSPYGIASFLLNFIIGMDFLRSGPMNPLGCNHSPLGPVA